jgi:hypothetical protein
MKSYTVRWEIDVEADSPEEAAARVLKIQRNNDPANLATVFDVTETRIGMQTKWKRVDLSAEEDHQEKPSSEQQECRDQHFIDVDALPKWSLERGAVDVCKLLVAYHDNLTPDSVEIEDVVAMARRVIGETK